MKTADLAIIIPTLNEEHYIGNLLDSISKQTIQPKEVVVVDAESKDRTVEKVKECQQVLSQLQLYQIPKYTISRQRNLGVQKTTAKHILFLDADVELADPETLEKYIDEVEQKKPDIAVAHNYPLSNYWKDRVYFVLIQLGYEVTRLFWPSAQSINMYVARAMFDKVNGFNEHILIGEDFEFLQRVVRHKGRFCILKRPKIYTSVRRFVKEGRRKFTFKVLRNFLYIHLKGYHAIPKDYEFGTFKKPDTHKS